MALSHAHLETLASSPALRGQYRSGGFLCLLSLLLSLALLPVLAQPIPAVPGFIGLNQTALVLVYGITTYLLFAQYAQTHAVSVLLLASGSLYTTAIVLLQLMCFPNVLTPGLLMGTGSDTLTWLWTFWHIGPPLFALPYAITESDGRPHVVHADRAALVGWLVFAGVILVVAAAAVLVTHFVQYLPKLTQGDSYWLLTTSGIGPMVELLTMLSLAVLCKITKLRTVLQLWLAVSLFLLVLDNLVTDLGAARTTVGWVAGRIGALIAGTILLTVYLRELDFLRRSTEAIAVEREAARAEAQSARDALALALEAAGMGSWELDLRSDCTQRTLQHDQIFGHSALLPHWGRKEFLIQVVPEDRARAAAVFDRAAQDGRLELECRIKRTNDKAVRWISLFGKTYYDHTGRATSLAGCVMDTTERRQTEDRLRQAERMEAIGQLTGGVAHDFNNLLTVITGSLEMLIRMPDNAGRVERFGRGALMAAQRGADLTSKLLAFSRRQVVRPEIANLNRLLQEFLPLMRQAVNEQVEVIVDLDATLDPARLDTRQFEAALLNLIANARDAMPSGGQIRISTRNVNLRETDGQDLGIPPGNYLQISVADTGFGMDWATARMAFEPFFTTKDVGKGTGLGLSQVYGFAKQAGGCARIASTLGTGTTIEILLPRSTAQAELPATSQRETIPLRPATQGEVVLVVEDEPAVLELAVESLRDLGYKTLAADTAVTALERLRSTEHIDILFSDIVMPGGMNGVQLAVVARTLRDGLKVVLTSGYTASALAHDHEMPAGTPLLSKPYAREDLALTLRSVLETRQA